MEMTEKQILREKMLAEKRHDELAGTLKGIANSLKNDDGDKKIADALKEQAGKFSELTKVIREIPSPEKPQVNVELNPKEFVTSIREMTDEILKSNNEVIQALENRLLPETFTLNRTYGGTVDNVKVNYKTQKEIKNKK